MALILPLFVTPVSEHHIIPLIPIPPDVLHHDHFIFRKDPDLPCCDPRMPFPAQPPPQSYNCLLFKEDTPTMTKTIETMILNKLQIIVTGSSSPSKDSY